MKQLVDSFIEKRSMLSKLSSFFVLCVCLMGLPVEIQAQSVDLRFVESASTHCEQGSFCTTIQVKSDNGADHLGSASIRFNYNTEVIAFQGDHFNGVNVGSFTPVNFDDNQNNIHTECGQTGGSPYSSMSFDGMIPGDFLFTFVLLTPTTFGSPSACPSIAQDWENVVDICFDILDPTGNPNLHFLGTENDLPESGTPLTNFNSDTNIPSEKYANGSFGNYITHLNCGEEEANSGLPISEVPYHLNHSSVAGNNASDNNPYKSVSLQFAESVSSNCEKGSFCTNIQVKSDNGADYLGSASIRFTFDPTVIAFEGSSLNGMNRGSFTPLNFDNDQNSLHSECGDLGGTPYGNMAFDGHIDGAFLLTLVLEQPTTFGNPKACPSIADDWEDVVEICFDILDFDGNPNLQFTGTENDMPAHLTSHTNFNSDTNNPGEKYANGSFGNYTSPIYCNEATVSNSNNLTEETETSVLALFEKQTTISLYPNPVQDQLYFGIEVFLKGQLVLEIFDANGQKVNQVFNESVEAGKLQLDYSVAHLSSGVYFYRCTQPGFVQSGRFVVMD